MSGVTRIGTFTQQLLALSKPDLLTFSVVQEGRTGPVYGKTEGFVVAISQFSAIGSFSYYNIFCEGRLVCVIIECRDL